MGMFAAELAVFDAECSRQMPVFVCFLPSLWAPLSTRAASWSVCRSHSLIAGSGQHVFFIRVITAQLSPLVLILLAQLNELLFFKQAHMDILKPKRCSKVMPNNNIT